MTTDSHSPDGLGSPTSTWVVAVDYETGAQVERRGPFTNPADIDDARRALRKVWKAGRCVVWVRVE